MIIRHSLPHNSYTKVDRHVFTIHELTDGACRLYGYLCGLRNGANFTDRYILKALDISQAVLTRRKKELKDMDLILVDQVDLRTYVVYIGHSRLPASDVKKSWVEEGDDNDV